MKNGPFGLIGYKKKRICLVDVDGTMANLALMKISAFFKKNKWKANVIRLGRSGYSNKRRDKFLLDASEYTKIFVSAIFSFNKELVEVNNCNEVYRDGMVLPYDIEHIYPDYSLYPDNKYSIGFLSRGCIRKCAFCCVPEKEGNLRRHSTLKEFYNPKLPKIMLLDNNFLAHPDCISILKELKKTGKKITFKQGLDFRLMNKKIAELLSSLDYDGEFIFAFDNYQDMPFIERNLKIWKPLVKDWQTKFYVLVGFNSTLQEDLERVFFLRKHKCLTYIMRYQSLKELNGWYNSPFKAFYTDLAAWCNQPGLFKNMEFKEFLEKRHATRERLMQTLKVIERKKLEISSLC